MRPSISDFMEVAKQKRKAGGESARPPKRSRSGRAGRAPAAVAPAAPVAAEAPAEETPAGESVPKQAGTGAMEENVSAAAEMVEIVDVEEYNTAVDLAEVGRVTIATSHPAVAEREKRGAPSAEPRSKGAAAAAAGEASGQKTDAAEGPAGCEETVGDPGSAALAALRLSRPRVEGAQERPERPAPQLLSMRDAAQAARLLSGLQTNESSAEMGKLGSGAVFDSIMVSIVQMANGALALRNAMSRASDSLAKARERAERHGKEALAESQKLARLQDKLKAQEGSRREAERRAEESASRVSALETELGAVSAQLRAMQAQAEEQARDLQQSRERGAMAEEEIRAVTRRAIIAEEAAVVAGRQTASAVVRAGAADNRACELEEELKKAKAEAEKAVENYKSSPEFTKELAEGGFDAFMKGFDTGKARVSAVLKIDSAEIDKVQLADEEEPAEEGGDDEAGAGADES